MQTKNILLPACFMRKYSFDNTERSMAACLRNFKDQAALHEKYGYRATYMPEYDALIDEDYLAEIRRVEANGSEIGFWFEVVQPLAEDCGIAWRGREGHPWDHYVNPGFLMAYTEDEKKLIIDTAMNKFRELLGYYPHTVGSWLLDSFSMQYMSENYPLDAFIICREQWGMDGYTLWGGPYYGAYYPSKNNMQTPATSEENRIKTPVFRMFYNDPIYCYYEHEHDEDRCMLFNRTTIPLFSQEPAGFYLHSTLAWYEWQLNNLCLEDNAGVSFIHTGQENCFGWKNRTEDGMIAHYEHLKAHPEYAFEPMTMAEFGRYFKETFKDTPPMATGALTDWGGNGFQSVWYNSKFYRVNIWNNGEEILIRDMHAFFDDYRDRYLDDPCTTPAAFYDNPPIVDGVRMTSEDGKTKGGFYFGKGRLLSRKDRGDCYEVTAEADGVALTVKLYPERVEITGDADFTLHFRRAENEFENGFDATHIFYTYGGISYALALDCGAFDGEKIESRDARIVMHIEQKK